MKYALLVAALALAALTAPRATAQITIDISRFDDLFSEEPTVEVNLRGSLLRLAAAATREDEPDMSTLIEGLNAITVRIYPLSSARTNVSSDFSDVGHRLEADGWSTFVRVRDTDEDNNDVWIYVRDDGDNFDGLVVMALDPDEDQAAFVLIDGHIDPDDIGRLSRFGNVHLNMNGNHDHDEDYDEDHDHDHDDE